MKFFRLSFIILMMLGILSATAQDTLPQAASDYSSLNTVPVRPLGKISTNVRLGTQFSSSSGYGSVFSTYVMPEISTNLTKRFSISGGIGYINSNYSGFKPYFFSEEKADANISTGLIYLSGTYLLNNKVTIAGSAYKSFDLSGNFSKYPYLSNEYQGFNMSVDYKVTDAFHIQAGFGYREGNYPYGSQIGDGFYDDPFGSFSSPFRKIP